MKRNRLRFISVIICLFVVAAVFSGCQQQGVPEPDPAEDNGNNSENNEGDEDPVVADPEPEPEEEPPEEDPPEEDPPAEKPPEEDVGNGDHPDSDDYVGDLSYGAVTGKNDRGMDIVLNTDSILLLVNKKRNLSADYVPKDLVKPNIRFTYEEDNPKKYLREPAAKALENLFAAASKAGHRLYGISGYRSYATQKRIFERNAAEKGEETANLTSARPGQSEHQTGLAMDISSASADYRLLTSFGNTPEGKWVRDNAHKYGFIIRYLKGKEAITGYSYEPWHLRYVGKEVAAYIFGNHLTLEEYFQNKYRYP